MRMLKGAEVSTMLLIFLLPVVLADQRALLRKAIT